MQPQNLPTKTTPPAPVSSWKADQAVDLLARRVESSSLVWDQGRARLTRALTPAETDCFKARLAAVRKSLMGANSETEMKRIAMALSAALMGYSRPDTDKLVRDYTRMLGNLPAWAIEQACDDIRRGAAPSINPAFPPAAPEIHKLAEEKMVEAKTERDRLLLLLTAKVDTMAPTPDEGAKERVAAKLQDFHDKVAKANPQETEQRRQDRQKLEQEKAKREEHTRRMEYIVQGYEPPTKDGKTMSIALARAIGMKLTKRAAAPPPKCEFSPEEE
jgi:hypothetical protein